MIRGAIWLVVAISFAAAAGADEEAEPAGKYIGASKCKTCHKQDFVGNQYAKWREKKHAHAFETLKSEKALEYAKQSGLLELPHKADECLKCHVTAYGEDRSAFAKRPLKKSEGIQCESCHGPGSGYKTKKIMSDRDAAVAAGLWEAGKDEKICTTCHNDESPAWDSTTRFDFEAAKAKIAHPIPADVKGKVVEIEKKLAAEKKARDEAEE